jgi:spore germination protein YaaH
MKKIFLLVFILIVIGGFWGIKNRGWLEPSLKRSWVEEDKQNLEEIGFLPSWVVGKTRLYGEELDQLIFLGVEVDEKGSLIWDYQGKKINDKEFLKQKEEIRKNGGKNILGIKLFRDEELDKLLKNDEAVENLVKQVKEVVKEDNFDGINIDFEYQNDPVAILSEDFFRFLEKIRESNLGEVSVDIFVNTINKGEAESLERLIRSVDYLIIMAYDFHRPGSDFVGPVSPIRAPLRERSVFEVVKKITDIGLNKEKIILAYPLYGYEWKSYGRDFGAGVKDDWCQMLSWKRSKELIEEKELEEKWDELSMSPWSVFEENGETYQIYYENEKSLKIKVKLARDNKFKGVAWWALGYEGKDNLFDY